MKNNSLKFAFIGCGKIAPFHAEVIRHLGHSIEFVVATKNSVNIDSFAKKYDVREKIYGIKSFLNYCKESENRVDAILVCTPWNVTQNVLRELLPLNIPIMSEKPVVFSMEALNSLKNNYDLRNLFVGYNRRFYDFIPMLKDLINKEAPICIDILSAEPYEMIVKRQGAQIINYMAHYYTSHIIDLMFYLLGDVEIKNIISISRNKKESRVCMLETVSHQCPIQMKILMDCPQNSYFRVFFEKKVVEMQPFERLRVYDKLEKLGLPGKATYNPSIKIQIETDDKFKPGFLNQAKYFIKNFVERRNSSREHIKQLERTTSFCDLLMKSKNSITKEKCR